MDEWHNRFSEEANIGELHRQDRLSELPDSLILEILSLLDIKDVVRTSLLSKGWKNLWSTIPCLCLDFFEQTPSVISSVLSQWKGPKILKFSFSFRRFFDPCSVIDSWLLFAIEKQVEELLLVLPNWPTLDTDEKVDYCLPQPLYSCSSITKLTLEGCQLKIEDNVQWHQLKRLEIRFPEWLSGDAVNQILLGAPLLEEFVLKCPKICENEYFNIQSTSLKMLKIQTGYIWRATTVLRIWAPNLLNFSIEAHFCGTCLLDVPSLTHARLSLVHTGGLAAQFEMLYHVFLSIRHVEKVTLSDWNIQMLVHYKKMDMVVPLSNSKILELNNENAKDILDLVGMFPKLERLIVDQFSRKDRDVTSGDRTHIAMVDACNSLASAKMTFPCPSLLHLKTFEATWYMRDPSIIPAIQILLENAPILEKMVIRLRQGASYPDTFILAQEKVLSMPRSSPTAQVIITLI
ncbi:F-box/LRR-repeat protein At3g26922-like [Salvia miltiorrhiza]|uniref:F-box/LRR-repeat protein At3g26922-like n=1 Tax=Salvia miltiorrhiza TaxID=226208 RepID=UPI0025AC88C6|nr:F-box/LRR-repeat protein At3g26922-like [Salvia miltiorrhiza]